MLGTPAGACCCGRCACAAVGAGAGAGAGACVVVQPIAIAATAALLRTSAELVRMRHLPSGMNGVGGNVSGPGVKLKARKGER